MGNINQSNYTLEKDYNDPRFGPIKLYSMNNQKYLEKVQTFANDYQTNDYLNLCQKNIEHPALLKLLHY